MLELPSVNTIKREIWYFKMSQGYLISLLYFIENGQKRIYFIIHKILYFPKIHIDILTKRTSKESSVQYYAWRANIQYEPRCKMLKINKFSYFRGGFIPPPCLWSTLVLYPIRDPVFFKNLCHRFQSYEKGGLTSPRLTPQLLFTEISVTHHFLFYLRDPQGWF